MGIGEQTFYQWRRSSRGTGIVELRRTKSLEEENPRLKSLVADLTLDEHMLPELLLAFFGSFPTR